MNAGTPARAVLLGEDHTKLGGFQATSVSANVAIGISRGRFPKGYAHVDPNEDAVFAADDDGTVILAVADGHGGFDAARAAITAIASARPRTIGGSPEAVVGDLAAAALLAVAVKVPTLSPPRDTSSTSLTICAIQADIVAAATFGDTACFVASRRKPARLGVNTEFLGPAADPSSTRVETAQLAARATVTVASDGFFDFAVNPQAVIRATPKLPPLEAVNQIVAAAFAGGAGDNIGVGVYRRT